VKRTDDERNTRLLDKEHFVKKLPQRTMAVDGRSEAVNR